MPPALFLHMRVAPQNPPDGPERGPDPRREGLPAWVTEDLIRRTLEIWGPRYKFPLSREDAIGIILTAGQLFGVLSRG